MSTKTLVYEFSPTNMAGAKNKVIFFLAGERSIKSEMRKYFEYPVKPLVTHKVLEELLSCFQKKVIKRNATMI